MPPLNPRHQAFATALVAGLPPSKAYAAAGYSPNNAKTRARSLSKRPSIRAQVVALRTQQLAGWLEEVQNGTRRINPVQQQAAKLYRRFLAKNGDRAEREGQPPAARRARTRVARTRQMPGKSGDFRPHGDRLGKPNPHYKTLTFNQLRQLQLRHAK